MIRKIKNAAHRIEAELATLIYSKGRRKIPTIGVTGTDGKTTTSSLIFHILKTAGYKPAMVTTVAAQIGDSSYDTGLHTTTPSAFTLQKYISFARRANCDYLILEITSHALDQNRAAGIDFKIGVLTNITHEHLDYHRTYEKYVAAKSKLLKKADIAVVNRDDESYELIKKNIGNKKIFTYSNKNAADFNPKNLDVNFPSQFEFNIENFLAAVSVAKILEIDNQKIAEALATFKFPKGRQEVVYDGEFRVIVDFAHTPNSFAKVLPAIKKTTTNRMIHIFGAAGLRDKSKRPLMGKMAGESDNIIILTAEDPRSEKIDDINRQIKLGIEGFQIVHPSPQPSPLGRGKMGEGQEYDLSRKLLFEISDRQEAFNFAVHLAQKGDTIIITGKGHEESMNLGHGEVPWSDHEAVFKAIKRRGL